MKKTFLYRFFSYSKTGFLLLMIYMVCYASCMYKKMDMLMFPYNDMFSHNASQEATTSKDDQINYLKVNGQKIPYTHFPYWKKDFIEQQNHYYGHFLQRGNQNHIDLLIDKRIQSNDWNHFLHRRLSNIKLSFEQWARWYAEYANVKLSEGDKLQLIEYTVRKTENSPIIIDSTIISQAVFSDLP